MLIRYALLLNLFVFLGCPGPVRALTMAVFPIEDLSQGQNGVNNELTSYLAWDMDRRGFDVINNESIVDFMGRNRIRWLGFLDTRSIIQAKEEMGADLILFGTVALRQEDLSPAFGITLYLVRTSDAKNLWTASGGLAQQDVVKLLGVGEPRNGEGLQARLAQDVLAKWPEDLAYTAKEQHALEIETIDLEPAFVGRGDTVSCKVTLRSTWSEEDAPRVFFKTGGRVYMASQNPAGNVFTSEWQVADSDGRYPVTMVINWPSGHKKVAFLGTYNIDSSPPKLVLDLKGVQLEGTVAFRDQVIIIPRMLRREPVARWKLTVEDENGKEQVSHKGYGELPRRFVWDGKDKAGWPAEEGIYKVSLSVWDRADNMAVATEPVAVARTPPAMVLEAKARGRDMVVDLSNEGRVPIAFWRIEMRDSSGLIKVAEGNELPMRMDLDQPGKVKVADGLEPYKPGGVIKVADGVEPYKPKSVIKVAEGLEPYKPKSVIKVAEGLEPYKPKSVIKVAEGLEPPLDPGRKVIKVADGIDLPVEDRRKVIKVADGVELPLVDKRKIIKVAGGDPVQTDAVAPEDQDKRKVEATIIIRDILGNQVRKKIDNLYDLAEQQEQERRKPEERPIWLEEF